jgi:hypothetical protein
MASLVTAPLDLCAVLGVPLETNTCLYKGSYVFAPVQTIKQGQVKKDETELFLHQKGLRRFLRM